MPLTQNDVYKTPRNLTKDLEMGARDGYEAVCMTEHADLVTAIGLSKSDSNHEKITRVQSTAASLDFDNRSFEVVVGVKVLGRAPSRFPLTTLYGNLTRHKAVGHHWDAIMRKKFVWLDSLFDMRRNQPSMG